MQGRTRERKFPLRQAKGHSEIHRKAAQTHPIPSAVTLQKTPAALPRDRHTHGCMITRLYIPF